MNLDLELQVSDCVTQAVPDVDEFRQWCTAAIEAGSERTDTEISIRVVDYAESQTLNYRFRGFDKPTNVLSFPADVPAALGIPLLGDLAICAALVEDEAAAQHKQAIAHWAHLTIHGTLHLLGYDHISDADAEIMETLEIAILEKFGYSNPYINNEEEPTHE